MHGGIDVHSSVRFYEGCGFTTTHSFSIVRPGRDPWPGQLLIRRLR
ncbi:hypothetical protein [Micromonospora sp. NBC_01638]|nr:hypothetical protein OG811_20975 [Micromonospora sp. NBC_01638]